MRRLLLGAAAVAALAAPGSAWGGGFSTIGLHELPTDVRAGQTWKAELTVLGHGRTPLGGMQPVVSIARPDGGARASFRAVETRRQGVYRANVTFPEEGDWALTITPWRDAVGDAFGIVDIEPRQPADEASASSAGDGWTRLLLALGAGLAAAGATSLLGRRIGPARRVEPTTSV